MSSVLSCTPLSVATGPFSIYAKLWILRTCDLLTDLSTAGTGEPSTEALGAAEVKIDQLESTISMLQEQKSTLEEQKSRENLAHTNDKARMKRAHDEEKKQVQMGNYSQAAQIHIQSQDEEIEKLTGDIKSMQSAAVKYQQEWIAKTQAWASSVGGGGAAGKPLLAILLAVALAVVIVIFIVVLIATRREGATR